MTYYQTIKAIAARSQDTLVQDAAGASRVGRDAGGGSASPRTCLSFCLRSHAEGRFIAVHLSQIDAPLTSRSACTAMFDGGAFPEPCPSGPREIRFPLRRHPVPDVRRFFSGLQIQAVWRAVAMASANASMRQQDGGMAILVIDRRGQHLEPVKGRVGHGARALEHRFELVAPARNGFRRRPLCRTRGDRGGGLSQRAGLHILPQIAQHTVLSSPHPPSRWSRTAESGA